jgi:hypothetical protein
VRKDFIPLFSGGSGRSGTTIIVNLFKHHPEIHSSLPREIKYLTSRYGLLDLNFGRSLRVEEDFRGRKNNIAARLLTLQGQKSKEQFLMNLETKWWSEEGKRGKPRGLVQGITSEQMQLLIKEFQSSSQSDLCKASQDLYFGLSRAQIKKQEVRYFIESTPVNCMHSHNITKLLPGARFINMIRDGRDVALSVSKEKWGPNEAYGALQWWGNRVLLAHQSLAQIPADQRVDIRLEELIQFDRQGQYEKILTFLGVSDSAPMREFFDLEMLPEHMSQGSWREQVQDPSLFDRQYDSILSRLAHNGISIEKFY